MLRPMPLLQLKNITVAFGGPPLLDGVDVTVQSGERLCLLGRNGAGKSTLLKVMRGDLDPNDGEIIRDPGVRVAYLEQHVPADVDGSVLDVVVAALGHAARDRAFEQPARAAISRVGLNADAVFAELSAGMKRRALLARAIASDPDVLLLDEPTNHLDIDSIDWLERFLAKQARALVFVTHDRALLRKLATGILDLDRGRLSRWDPDYDVFLERKQGLLETEARTNRKFDKKLAQEEVWIRQGVRERRKRNMGRVARLREMRTERGGRRDVEGRVRMEAQAGDRSGRIVLRAKGLTFAYEGKSVIRGLDLDVMRGDRIGIIGPNGSGKTTLLRLLLAELEPDSGHVRKGVNLQVGYFDQLHAELDENATAAENVGEGASTVNVNGKSRQVVSYLNDFLFTADQARSPVRTFSGGERNRLLLARIFARPSNVLVLDEPTNDLDVETLEVLEDLLANYEGTVLVVSHDRELLDHVVTSTLVLDGTGGWKEYVGGYSDYVSQRAADAPKRKKSGGRRKGKARPVSPLSKEEKRELRELPARIEKLEEQQAALHEQMADPAFFKEAGDVIATAKKKLEDVEAAIQTAYARWEVLEEKRTG